MDTNPKQLSAKVEESPDEATNEIINQDPEIAVEEKKPREEDSPLPYRYVEPEFYNEGWQETQQETPLDRKILAFGKAADELEEQNKKTDKGLNHGKRRWLFFGIIPTLVAVSGTYFFHSRFFGLRK